MPKNDLRQLPSVDALIQAATSAGLTQKYGRDLVLRAIREALADVRGQTQKERLTISSGEILRMTEMQMQGWLRPTLLPVINASGVILHTNLGRAPLSQQTLQAIQEVSAGYSSLEYDLTAGKRGQRAVHAEGLLQLLTGAESALVVNNNAAALLLVLTALAKGKRVVIAHSQLVEIGGGFRVPDVMRQSGAKLQAIGTTNRVHMADYQSALESKPALVLTAHHSNFRIIGFTAEPELQDISRVCHQSETPLVYDLGSGALLDTAQFGLAHEPTVQEGLAAGAHIVCFSGDKLMGGPQAGIIIGCEILLDKIKRHPLARALRADKLILAGVSATLTHYLKGEALTHIPVWRMLSTPRDEIAQRARSWQKTIAAGHVLDSQSMIGGGSLPEESMPTDVLGLTIPQPNRLVDSLRRLPLPIIARIEQDKVLFDPRTVLPEQDAAFVEGLKNALNEMPASPHGIES